METLIILDTLSIYLFAFFSILGLRNRVIATTAPWVAAHDALDTKPSTFKYSIFHHGLYHILATSRSKSATWMSQWRDARAIKVHRQ